jgi:adenosylcobinamide kinase/adenosylcobinamide-phosphate guanylyltransferase
MGKLTLILGGARSGKSTLAQKLAAQRAGRIVFIATALAGDEEMVARIAAHQRQRPPGWQTLEIPSGVADTWRAQGIQAELAILDCLTFLVTNLALAASPDVDHPDEEKAINLVADEIRSLIAAIQTGDCDWIIVSNEVGLGLVPPYPLGRIFRDCLGWANQQLAGIADQVFLLVGGIPVPIHTFR